jgi:Protein of unknown function, DUF547
MTKITLPATLPISRRTILVSGAASGVAMTVPSIAFANTANIDTRYAALLARYVVAGRDGVNRVAYGRWKANAADMTAIAGVVTGYEAIRPSTLSREARFAFWVNLYNALTLKVVLEAFPVRSIRNIGVGGPWRRALVTVEGRRLSLDDIEHRTLRTGWREPRIHYAVNCASIGCPNLMARPWSAATLEGDLDRAARAYVNSPRGVRAIGARQVRVSSIYHWFKEDFGGNNAGVLAHLRRYADADLRASLDGASIDGHDYDWSVNSAG